MSKQKVSLKVELKKKSWNYANFCDKKSTNLLHYTILTTKRKEDFDKVAGCLITGEFVKLSLDGSSCSLSFVPKLQSQFVIGSKSDKIDYWGSPIQNATQSKWKNEPDWVVRKPVTWIG